MTRRTAALALSLFAASGLVLASCASEPAVDLEAAQVWLDSVTAAESDGPGAISTMTMLIGPERGEDGVDNGIRVDLERGSDLTRADAQCYGGVTAQVSVTVFTDGGTASDSFGAEVPCDEQRHSIDLDTTGVTEVLVEATSPSETYLHVALLLELTVE